MPDTRAGPAVIPHHFEVRPIAELRPHPRNARQGNVAAVSGSIDALGFYGVVIVQQSTGYLLAGHTRSAAAAEQGLSELPVMVVDVDDETAERILLGDNRYADIATWDEAALVAQLDALALTAQGLDGTGFSEADLMRMVGAPVSVDTGGDDSERLGETYAVLVRCTDELHQAEVLEWLMGEGLDVKALTG